MPEPEESLYPEFDAQMRGLFEQAEKVIETRAREAEAIRSHPSEDLGVATKAPPVANGETAAPVEQKAVAAPAKRGYPSLPQMLRPIVLGLEAVTRATGENNSLLQKLDKAAEVVEEAQKDLPHLVLGLREVLEQKNGVSQRMFDALHQELKDYKDGFLLETVHRPIIRDLISVYDDLAEIHRQISAEVGEQMASEIPGSAAEALLQRMKTMETNVGHKLDFIMEVLARLDVSPLPRSEGKLDKHTQRAVAVEMVDDPDEDSVILRTVKCGFLWKDRVLRAEEVVMKKWKQSFIPALEVALEK